MNSYNSVYLQIVTCTNWDDPCSKKLRLWIIHIVDPHGLTLDGVAHNFCCHHMLQITIGEL